MNKIVRSVVALIISFSIAALLSQAIFYDVIDRFAMQTFNNDLSQYRDQINNRFDKITPELWQQQSSLLSDLLSVHVTIDKHNADNFSEETLEQLASPIGTNGIIDLDMGLIYYPLSPEYVLVAGPIDDVSLAYAAEIFTWMFALLVAITTVCLLHYQDIKAMRRLSESLSVDSSTSNDLINIDSLISQADMMSKTNLQKSKALDQLLVTQRDLLHGIAHEFRSPLARMEFAIELLEEADGNKRAQLKGQLEDSIKELDELVKQVLRYSRLQHDGAEIELSLTSVKELVETSIEKVQGFYPKIQYVYDDETHYPLNCDVKLMVIALSNILRNAGRFAYSRCLVTVESDNHSVIISIQDDGSGLAPGKKNQIFEPFTRLDPSRSRDSGGYGLGLAIVQSIIHKHKGTVSVEDAGIGGANFIIKLG
ncbi:signal transduction histidine kinase [Shewanella psychrophila]|uniref:histidine kinase n=1 Tax=Shewanella psychrophila TaxID=225848 RepID=A0A1S6HMB0_9GAMM|nr:ATP-binding protein [Shewanella psychrophila]AQS36666.1 signal transduction histidine kinase [Shewanella psychrophila]